MALAFAAVAATCARAPAADPSYVGNVGPMHGAWAMNGKPVASSEAVPAGATFSAVGKHVARGTPRSISIFLLDGRLVTKSCLDDATCGGHFTLDDRAESDVDNADAAKATSALQRYRLSYATPASRAALDSTPADGVVRRGDAGIALGEIFAGIAPGSYRLEFRHLNPNDRFAAGDPISHRFEWATDAGILANAELRDGLYSLQLFSAGGMGRELGSPAWIVVLGDPATDAAKDFARARALTRGWKDAEATQTFLRAYLTNIATTR